MVMKYRTAGTGPITPKSKEANQDSLGCCLLPVLFFGFFTFCGITATLQGLKTGFGAEGGVAITVMFGFFFVCTFMMWLEELGRQRKSKKEQSSEGQDLQDDCGDEQHD
jgi:preprotein translocase subunit YajC